MDTTDSKSTKSCHSRPWLTVIGGNGFVGSAIVEEALSRDIKVRVISRCPPAASENPNLEFRQFDITQCLREELTNRKTTAEGTNEGTNSSSFTRCDADLRKAMSTQDSFAVINAVSLWDAPDQELRLVHVEAAAAISRICAADSAESSVDSNKDDIHSQTSSLRGSSLVHISGLGADVTSPDPYLRIRGQGDAAVLQHGPNNRRKADEGRSIPSLFNSATTTILRPGGIVSSTSGTRGLVSNFVQLASMRVCPLFGFGSTQMQPILLDDLARLAVTVATLGGEEEHRREVVVAESKSSADGGRPAVTTAEGQLIVNAVGPEVLTFKEVLSEVANGLDIKFWISVPFPFFLWNLVASVASALNPDRPLVTHAQVKLMRAEKMLIDWQSKEGVVEKVVLTEKEDSKQSSSSTTTMTSSWPVPIVAATDILGDTLSSVREAIRLGAARRK